MRHDNWVLVDAPTGAITAVPVWFNPENSYAPHSEPGELYALGRDLSQRENLHAKHPEKVAELKQVLASIRAKGQVR